MATEPSLRETAFKAETTPTCTGVMARRVSPLRNIHLALGVQGAASCSVSAVIMHFQPWGSPMKENTCVGSVTGKCGVLTGTTERAPPVCMLRSL